MKVAIYSNAPWYGSGYGTQTAALARRLVRDGYDVAILSNVGIAGRMDEWEGIPVYPGGIDKYSNDIAVAHYYHFVGKEQAALITLYDGWVLDPSLFGKVPNIISWLPVDHAPVPFAVAGWASLPNVRPVAMSRFGQAAFAAEGIDAAYVPHSIDTNVYRPRPDSDFRKQLRIPADAFVIGIVAANAGNHPPRKGWSEMLQAAGVFMRDRKDAYLYLHTHPTGTQGIDLTALLAGCAIPEERVRWVSPYNYLSGRITDEMMAGIYSGLDVLLATSYGEGFGLPVIEAQAAGVPVIVSDWTAQPELVGAGWVVPVQPWWDAPHGAFFGIPFIREIVEALVLAYDSRGVVDTATVAREFALQYDHEVIQPAWRPIIDRPAPGKIITPPKNLAIRKKKR